MAVVHRAVRRRDDGSLQEVALKRLLPHLAEDAAFIRAFAREARMAQGLHHENVCLIHELGRVGDSYFISMELLEGSDLRALLRRSYVRSSTPPLEAALSLLVQLCAALDHAHNATDPDTGELLGLVHRDVSPANVLVTSDGTVKVIDFGIAKATLAKFQTETGRFRGKLGYLSPEAIQGQSLDGRSDLFSVGVIAYELLTARPLFGTVSDFETLSRVQFGKVDPPSSLNEEVPPALDEAVMSALAKEPGDRWASAAAMRDALREIAPGPSLEALAAWAAQARREKPAPGPLGFALARRGAGGSPTEQVVDLVWGSAGKSEPGGVPVVPEVPDLAAPLPPVEAIPAAEPDQRTVQMWALDPRPRGKRGHRPPGAPLALVPAIDENVRDTVVMPTLQRGEGEQEVSPELAETVKMEQLLRDPSHFETVEIAALEQITSARETLRVAPFVRPRPERTDQLSVQRRPPRQQIAWLDRWDQVQLVVAALLLLVSPLGHEEQARADSSPPAARAVLADAPATPTMAAPAPAATLCRLEVTSRPRHALVWIDDKVLGDTPFSAEVDCTGGLLAIEKDRYRTEVRSLSFDDTGQVAIDVSLKKRRETRRRR